MNKQIKQIKIIYLIIKIKILVFLVDCIINYRDCILKHITPLGDKIEKRLTTCKALINEIKSLKSDIENNN